MSEGEFNQALWAFQNWAGWWFWVPFPFYGGFGLCYLYSMPAAEGGRDRLIRVLLFVSYLSMLFTPAFNGLGGYAFHIMAFASLMARVDQYVQSKRAGKIRAPESHNFVGRLTERMVETRRERV